MKFIGYYDIGGMSIHQAITHLTEEQQGNYRAQICAMLQDGHFAVDESSIELAVVADEVFTVDSRLSRLRLQYTADLTALPAPKPSGLIVPGQDGGGLVRRVLQPLPEKST